MTSSLGDEVETNLTNITSIDDKQQLKSDPVVSNDIPDANSSGNVSVSNQSDTKVYFDEDQIKKEPRITSEAALGTTVNSDDKNNSQISAYARLDFDNYTFFVQTLQVILGRKSNDELLNGSHAVDVHLSSKKAISRRHAKIFYNFGTQRFELSIMGRNGAFVDDLFLEKGMTVPLVDGTKIQIGDIPFQFVLPSLELDQLKNINSSSKPINPSDAISLRTNLYNSPTKKPMVKAIVDRKNSFKIPRKLSEARRKSLATATSDEIQTLLGELGVKSIEDIDEQDPEFVDAQIRAILGDGHDSAIMDDDSNDNIARDMNSLSQYNEGEEDEIDKLVKQHNLEQGVELDEGILEKDDSKVDITIDEDIRPLIEAHNQYSRHNVDEIDGSRQLGSSHNHSVQQPIPNQPQIGGRPGPLMGKLATPRMGRPASIQPPASRLWQSTIPKNSVIDSRLQSMSPPNVSNYGTNYLKQSTRKSVPELCVPIPTIERKPYQTSYDKPTDRITVTRKITNPNVWETRVLSSHPIMIPKVPKRKTESIKKLTKTAYALNEIPEQYRTKPSLTFSVMIINVIKLKNQGLSLSAINETIKDVYPYYKYCPEGWQTIVNHNVRLNKLFKRVADEEDEENEKWVIDESFVQEKEKVRKKQQELATQRAKEAAIKAEELKQKQRLEMQQSISQNIAGRDLYNPLGHSINQYKSPNGYQYSYPQYPQQGSPSNTNGKPKTIAELASEIRRDGIIGSKAPLYFKGTDSKSPPNIKAQLAANRSQYSQSPPNLPSPTASTINTFNTVASESNDNKPTDSKNMMNQDTKKSLAYLQKELFTLYKSRKLSYNTATTTEIITKALATTIAQVNAIGSKAGVGDNALSFLVERAPQQVSKILDIALSKSIKEKQGVISGSKPASKISTPVTSNISSPKLAHNELTKTDTPSKSNLHRPEINENNKRLAEESNEPNKVIRLDD